LSWSALFDRTHILKEVPVDANIELQCRKCKTLFHTKNAYYIGYSVISYANPEEEGICGHDITELKPTKMWFPIREIHKKFSDGTWASLFDYSHILEGVPIDADIELKCKKCNILFYTMNAYYIGYSEIYYVNPEEEGKCNHSLKEVTITINWFPKPHHDIV
jgi:phage FluMu protein Com